MSENRLIDYGKQLERERRLAHLNKIQTWYPDKASAWYEGYETAEARILKMLEDNPTVCSLWVTGKIEELNND
jgi:hypothetical protein